MSGLRDLWRDRFDVRPAHHRTRPLAAGLAIIALGTLALLSAALRHVPLVPSGGRTVTAVFSAADQVSGRTVVRVGGVDVGEVVSVGPGPNPYRNSTVTMRLTDGDVHLHSDATARIRWRTIFGGLVYVDLNPGSTSAPALSGSIPASHTSNQVELDELVATYSGVTAAEQRNVIAGLSSSLSTPAAIDQTLHALAPDLKTIGAGLGPLQGTDSGDLSGLVKATARTIAGIDDSSALTGLVSGADQTLAVIDGDKAQLGQALQLLPPSLASTSTTMARLRVTLNKLDPLVSQLHPGAQALSPAIKAADPALSELNTVLRNATPLLHSAGPALVALHQASSTGVPLIGALTPTVQRTLNQLLPFLKSTDSATKLKIYESIGPFFSDIDSAASQYDSVGHRIRLSVVPAATGFLTAPPSSQLQAACEASALTRSGRICPSLVGSLTRSWLTAFKETQ